MSGSSSVLIGSLCLFLCVLSVLQATEVSDDGGPHFCPGKTGMCPDTSTCCKVKAGGYGCCNHVNATCCSDGVHCCAGHSFCFFGHCIFKDDKVETPKLILRKENTVCPQGGECPGDDTCCTLATGEAGCCPYPNAVCCQDGLHCCPGGTTCNEEAGTCDGANRVSIPWASSQGFVMESSLKKEDIVVCPGGQVGCPDGNTCCILPNGQWGCCPIPQAVCCPDKLHCCPSGTRCQGGTCTRGTVSIPWSTKMPSTPMAKESSFKKEDIVVCPGGQVGCPDGNTCCILPNGQWGCCPIPQAVCCPDKLHCCPSGTRCQGGTCIRGTVSIPWSTKVPSTPMAKESSLKKEDIVVCPGGQVGCPDGNTCCLLPNGQWGCCPIPQAVCCPDKLHCCPSGTSCQGGTCTGGTVSIPWSTKMPSTPLH